MQAAQDALADHAPKQLCHGATHESYEQPANHIQRPMHAKIDARPSDAHA